MLTLLRKLFATSPARHPQARRKDGVARTTRPQLEALEDRQLLNASAAFDAAGNKLQLLVDTAGTLTEIYLGQTTTLATDVRRAHAYRDSDGSVGFTILYQNLNAYDYDHTGGHYLGQNIVDVDKAFDRAGHLQEDITYSTPGGFATFEYTSAGARQVPQQGIDEVLIHPFQDSQGNLGEDVSYINFNNGAFTVTLVEYDSGGAHYLGQNAEADRAYDPTGQQTALDITYASGVAVEYTNSSATLLGTNINR
jgi:hypothetical protein